MSSKYIKERTVKMYQIEILKDSPKGAFTKTIANKKSNKASNLFTILNLYEFELFPTGYDTLNDAVLDALANIKENKQNLYAKYQADIDNLLRLKQCLDFESNNANDNAVGSLEDIITGDISDLTENEDLVNTILTEISSFNIGVSYQQIS